MTPFPCLFSPFISPEYTPSIVLTLLTFSVGISVVSELFFNVIDPMHVGLEKVEGDILTCVGIGFFFSFLFSRASAVWIKNNRQKPWDRNIETSNAQQIEISFKEQSLIIRARPQNAILTNECECDEETLYCWEVQYFYWQRDVSAVNI